MTVATFLWGLGGVQAGFVALDLLDRHRTRDERYDGERVSPGSALFFVAIAAGYTLLQGALAALAPSVERVMSALRTTFGGAAPSAESSGLTVAIAAVLVFYMAGFWDYAWHRWFSHHRWFWFTHEYHHLPNQVFAGMPGIVARPFGVLTTIPVLAGTVTTTYAACRAFGLPFWDAQLFAIPFFAAVVLLTASHSSFLRRGWIAHHVMRRLALTTPHEHLLHHTVDLEGNYGNFTTLWDRVFGTYLDPLRAEHQGRRLGLAYDRDFLGAVTLGALRIPRRWRRRYQLSRYCNVDE